VPSSCISHHFLSISSSGLSSGHSICHISYSIPIWLLSSAYFLSSVWDMHSCSAAHGAVTCLRGTVSCPLLLGNIIFSCIRVLKQFVVAMTQFRVPKYCHSP
jgi:hypothetical protein